MAAPTRRRRTQAERVAESASRLMAAAFELIAERGYERTTASDIAARAGYSHTMVAARYGSKEALVEKLVETDYETRMAPPADVGVGLAGLMAWVEEIREQVRDEPEHMNVFFTLIFESTGPIPSLRAWTAAWLDRCVADAERHFLAAQKAGDISAELNPRAEADVFVLSCIGYGFRYLTDGDFARYDDALAEWLRRLERMRSSS